MGDRVNLIDVRPQLVEELRGDDDRVNVHLSIEAVDPPGLLLVWEQPWLLPEGFCNGWAYPAVLCVAGRISPDAGVEMLDRLTAFVLGRLGKKWPWDRVNAPQITQIAGVDYLTCRVVLRVPVSWRMGEADWPSRDEPVSDADLRQQTVYERAAV